MNRTGMNNRIFLALMLIGSIAYIECAQPATKAAVATKTAFVDMNKIFNLENLSAAPEEIRDRLTALKDEIEQRVKKLQDESRRYQKEAEALTNKADKTQAAKYEELGKMRATLELEERAIRSYQENAFQELQAEMFPKIQKAAEAVAKRQGWHRVDFGPALYIAPETDITADVIAELNKEYRAQKAAQKFKKTEKSEK